MKRKLKKNYTIESRHSRVPLHTLFNCYHIVSISNPSERFACSPDTRPQSVSGGDAPDENETKSSL